MSQIHKENFAFTVAVRSCFVAYGFCSRLFVLVQNPQRNADVGGIKQVAGQYQDCLHKIVFNQFPAYFVFLSAAAQCAVGKDKSRHAVFAEFAYHIKNPAVVGVAFGRHIVALPARVVHEFVFCPPILLVKGRICHNIVGFQVAVLVVKERVGGFVAQVARNATNGKVHFGKFVSGVGVFLSIYTHFTLITIVRLDKLHTLHKHTTRTASGVVDDTGVWFNHFCN